MADRGILFSAPMVRALLAGRKTQTRRLIRNPEYYGCPTGDCPHERQVECNDAMQALAGEIVPHAVGDRLWVRETWGCHWATDNQKASEIDPDCWSVRYAADGYIRPARRDGSLATADQFKRGRPSIFMPRWASRLWLTVTDVRVQRLQDIDNFDCVAEGIERAALVDGWKDYGPEPLAGLNSIASYRTLWNSLHTEPGTRWADNPWIYALTFTVHQGNIDD